MLRWVLNWFGHRPHDPVPTGTARPDYAHVIPPPSAVPAPVIEAVWLAPGAATLPRAELLPPRDMLPITTMPQAHPEPVQEDSYFYDPALTHFSYGLSLADPVALAPEVKAAWTTARRAALEHLLRLVAASKWRDDLVLRGSATLRAWLGAHAREPRDLDWVVRPATIPDDGIYAIDLQRGLLAALAADAVVGPVTFATDKAASCAIWTYDRASGRRLAVPWFTAGGLSGTVQMDIVFGEDLPVAPEPLAIPMADGSTLPVLAATRELSLAWKLLWLQSDGAPQGKDLYDAVLLAEGCSLPYSLMAQVLATATATPLTSNRPRTWNVDWKNFLKEYPMIPGEVAEWKHRLASALVTMPGWRH